MVNLKLLKAIVSNGDRYCDEHLAKFKPQLLLTDPCDAFDFFLSRACFQGRRDEMSMRVYDAARKITLPLIGDPRIFKTQKEIEWSGVKAQLRSVIGKGKVGKERDVAMIISALDFVSVARNENIVSYSVDMIRTKKLQWHYNQLQARKSTNGITQIGPKIAAFYLRDIVSLLKLDTCVDNLSGFCLQPVDTWVKKIVQKLGIAGPNDEIPKIQRAIVTLCEDHGVSAIRFNQGAWYSAFYSFDLMLELLSK